MCFFCRCWVVSQPAEEHSDAASVRPWHQRVHSEAGTETHASSGQTGPGSLQEHQWLVCGYAGCCWDSQSQQPDGADTGRSVVRLRHCLTYTDKLKKTVATWTKDKLRSLCLPEYYCHTFVLWLKTLCRDWDLFYAEALKDLIVTRTQRIVLWIIFWYCFFISYFDTSHVFKVFVCVRVSLQAAASWLMPVWSTWSVCPLWLYSTSEAVLASAGEHVTPSSLISPTSPSTVWWKRSLFSDWTKTGEPSMVIWQWCKNTPMVFP